MEAAQINSYGGPEVIEINEIDQPNLGTGQVLVKNYAASINPFDWKVRSGLVQDMIKLEFPATLGGDFAGKVIGVSEDVIDFKVGDEVYGQAPVFSKASGAMAEVVAANTKSISRKPTKSTFEEAAALPLAGVSALQALEDHIKLQPGQKILIHGGAGGIGHIAIQIANALGAYVATTVSSDDIEYVKSIGADEVINYKSEKFETILSDFDAVFDTVGGEGTNKSFEVLKKEGVLVSMAGNPDQNLAKEKEIEAISQFTQVNTDRLSRLAKYVDEGKLKVMVDKVFSLDETKDAFTYQENGNAKGKVVIKIR